jgi:hypothetical protein
VTADRGPIEARNCTAQYDDDRLVPADPDDVMAWSEAADRLAAGRTYWFTTLRSDGRPHTRPVLAVWVDGRLFTTTSPAARKGRNLAERPICSVAVSHDGIDLVLEGVATVVHDADTLQGVGAAYREKYGWPVTIDGGAFHAPFGAPAAGPPPYQPYAVTPQLVFAFGTDERFAPRSTRWRFAGDRG